LGSTTLLARAQIPVVPTIKPALARPLVAPVGLSQPGLEASQMGIDKGPTPPDTQGAIGLDQYMEMVRNLVAVYSRQDLTKVAGPMDLAAFLNVGPGATDPQLQWDDQGSRWLYAALVEPPSPSTHRIAYGWSKTSDASDLNNGWCKYSYDTGGRADFPKLGHSEDYLVVAMNTSDTTNRVIAIEKPSPGDASCPASPNVFPPWDNLALANGTVAKSIVAVNRTDSYTRPDPFAILLAQDFTTHWQIRMWEVKRTLFGPDLFVVGDVPVNQWPSPDPPDVPQPPACRPGSTSPCAPINPKNGAAATALTQAVSHLDPDLQAEAVWTQHTVASSDLQRAVVRWYEIGLSTGIPLRQQGELSDPIGGVFNAAISPSIAGNDAMIVYNRGDQSTFAMIAARTRSGSTPLGQMEPTEIVLASAIWPVEETAAVDVGQRNCVDVACRWGDYAAATPDPLALGVVWGSSQYAGPFRPLPGDPDRGLGQWRTQNFSVATARGRWSWQNPLAQGNDLSATAMVGANTVVAVGGARTVGAGVDGAGTILRTADGGATWTHQALGTTHALSGVAFTDANTGTAVGILGTIVRTTNGGTTWTQQTSGTLQPLRGVSFADTNTGTAVGGSGTILHTTDGGATWTPQSSGTTQDLWGVVFTDANTGTVVGGPGTILHTTDGGTTWTPQSGGTTQFLFAVSFTDVNTGTVVGGNGTVLRTTDGGATWVPQSSGTTQGLTGVAFTNANTGTAVGGPGTILRTTNGGATWTPESSGTTEPLYGVAFTDASTGTAVGWYGTVLRTTDGGATWTLQASVTNQRLTGVSFTDADTGTAVGLSGTILHTIDGGVTWIAQSSGTTQDLLGVSFTDANTGTAVGSPGTILRTTNGGVTWTRQSSGTSQFLAGVAFTDANNGTVVGGLGTVLRTTDGGSTWTVLSSGTTQNLYGVAFTDANSGTVVGYSGTILHTTDGGTTWTPQSSGTTQWLFGVSFTDANTGTAVGDQGTILRTTDGGTTWNPQASGTTAPLWGVSFTDANTGTVVGPFTILRTTNGGATWTPQASDTIAWLTGVSFTDANTGTAVGFSGTILRTINGGG
jgi:photosystem II stability/assembly factor-like uncharacterized protein